MISVGVTYRGCLSDVDDDFFADCSSGNSTSCDVCTTNNCNVNIYTESRRSCIQCNSDIFSACHDGAKDFPSICKLYDENESCVTKLESNRTIRGCASEITCDRGNSATCRFCNKSDNCNAVNLLSAFIGEPGKWQKLPVNCYHCEAKECNSGNVTLGKCQGNNFQTCVTVFNAEGIVVQRGCSDAVITTLSEYYDENTDKCLACKSNACNSTTALDAYINCFFCDSSESNNCAVNFDASKTKTRKCQKSCMVALYTSSSENDPSYELTRTCLDDLDSNDRRECSQGNNDLCKACDDARCNTMNVPDERFECYTCADDDCEDMTLQQCTSYHLNNQCYILFNNENSIMAMGCRSELELDLVNELVKQKQLLLCNEMKCNSPQALPTPKVCLVCSSAENPLCATNPNLVGKVTRCASLPYTACFTLIDSYGYTMRGCIGSLEEDKFYGCIMNTYGLCEVCVGDKCNEIDVYPDNRRICQQCNSTNDPKCASTPNSNNVCKIYKENDQCMTNYRNGVTIRGCKSSMKCNNDKDSRTCRACEDDGCNIINMQKVIENGFPGRWQDTPINCYTCKGEEECSSKGDLRPCVKNPLQSCMTVFDSITRKVFQRGCSDTVERDNQLYCEENSEKCIRCNSNGCNKASSLSQYLGCSYCDSDVNGNCTSNAAGVSSIRQCYKFCMTALYLRFKEDNPSYGLSRSCYDDMDPDERELCVAGKKKYCKSCNTPRCNIIDIAEERYSCYICEEFKCQNPKVQKCSTYRLGDKCYSRFDEKNQLVALGCRSQFSNVEADYLLKQKRILLCDDEKCNSLRNIPDVQSCVLCNSRNDKNCAVNAAATTGETYCAVKPFTDCYTRLLVDGATERGCLSSLYDDEFFACLNGTSTTCQSCKGNHCNKDDFPKSRLKCHVCASSVDPHCEANPNSLNICSKYDPEDTCVTEFRNSITYRDCSSNLVCDVTNPSTCKKCSGDGCNIINLAQKQDDNFGMWQDLPLICFSCLGNECNSETTNKSVTCALNNKQDCMTVFDGSGKVVARGCSSSVESESCEGNDENCYKCKSNYCNKASSKNDFKDCVYCKSHNDYDCIWNPLSATHKIRKCQDGCMSVLYPTDNSLNPVFELIRTCLNDKELSDQQTCSKGKDKNCSACSGSKCNTNNIPETRLSCFACKEEICEEPEPKICPLYRDNDYCFIRFDDTNSVSEMGCTSSYRNQDLESIIKSKRVHVCSGSNCNILQKLPSAGSCAFCNTTEDVSCAVSPADIATFNACTMLPYRSCYTKLTNYGTTDRGCLTDLPEDNFAACVLGNDNNCDVCNESGCNREIFPWHRQQCFSCTSMEQSDCDSFPTAKKYCPIFSETESCVTALNGNVTVRGCKSLVYCDTTHSATCRSCYVSECNSIDLLNKQDDGYHGVWQKLPLKCHTCVGKHCLYSIGPTVTCSNRNINQDCMTVFDEQGRVVYRGCSDDVEDYNDLYCRQHPERCFKCKSNECNIAWSTKEYIDCLFCDSANETLCVHNPDGNGFSSRQCYKNCMVAMENVQVIRSCLDDMEMWVQHQCQHNDSKKCSSCSENNCNNYVFPNDRLKCHVCTSVPCSSSVSQYCELYDNNDFCFAEYENGLVNLMGCASSQNASDIDEWAVQNKLYKCESSDCNELSSLPKEGDCMSCDSNKTPNCAQNPFEINTTETCPAPNNKCFTRINHQGHTIRGCLSNLNVNEQSCELVSTCAACTKVQCNNQIYPSNRRECHMCSSTAENTCKKNPSSLKICPIYDANDKCISALDSDGFLKRGCASQVECFINDSNYCNICNINGCNTIELTGSANIVTHSLFLTLLLAFASLLVFKYQEN